MMKKVIFYVVILYAVLAVAVYFIADINAFYPPKSSYVDNSDVIKLTTEDGKKISAVYLPNANASYTMLVSHGNAEDLGYTMPFLKKLNENGFSVFSYDYQGYGTSEGRPAEKNVYQDVRAAYDYLVNKLNVQPTQIVLYGKSLGAAAAIDLASQAPVGGVIIESAFTTAIRTVTQYPIFPFDRFNNIDKIKKVTAPVLVIHGKNDAIIPLSHSEKLYEAANCPKDFLWIEDAGHNDLRSKVDDNYWQKMRDVSSMANLMNQVKENLRQINKEKDLFS
jgi:fermentation-respiration switch protein FrsA (DUF1100 family)